MTIEHKIVLGLDDIKAVSFQCNSCLYRITMSPDQIVDMANSCPNGHKWIWGVDQISQRQPVAKFFEALGTLRTLTTNKTLGYQILLEFDEPKAI